MPPKPLGLSPGSVAEEDHAAADPAFVHELELDGDLVGEPSRAAAEHDRRDEPKEHVEETCLDRPGGEPGTTHGEVSIRRCLHLPDRRRVEVPFDPRPRWSLLQGFEYMTLSTACQLRVVANRGRLVGEATVCAVPVPHHLVHPPPVQVGADPSLEALDERVDLVVRSRPVEAALLLRDIAIERGVAE